MPLAAVYAANPGCPECQACTGQYAEVSKVNTEGSLGISPSLAHTLFCIPISYINICKIGQNFHNLFDQNEWSFYYKACKHL